MHFATLLSLLCTRILHCSLLPPNQATRIANGTDSVSNGEPLEDYTKALPAVVSTEKTKAVNQ